MRNLQKEDLFDYNILLAVQNIKDGKKKIEIIKLSAKGTKSPAGFTVVKATSNGVNTPFTITCPDGYAVLALRRVVKSGQSWSEVVYTPYSKEINTAVVRQAGWDYLNYCFREAKNRLRQKQVKSLAYGGLIADVIPDSVALVLALIEHIDPYRFESGVPIDQLINEALVIDGANQGVAYSYSVSPAGARGLFQFMPTTYSSIVDRYRSAKLEPDFVCGMNNHVNAAQASLLLFDADLTYLSPRHRQFLRQYPSAMGKYLAAAYNGGAKRANDAIQTHNLMWETKLLDETVTYLKKFQAVWDYLKK